VRISLYSGQKNQVLLIKNFRKMKNNILKLSAFLLIVSLLFSVGCSKNDDDSSSDKNKNDVPNNNQDKTENVPDPPGTITSNIAVGSGIRLQVSDGEVCMGSNICIVSWAKPDNISTETNCTGYLASICSVGHVKGLGSITNIPTLGYTAPANRVSQELSCEVGYGYVVKIECSCYLPPAYARMYVVEKIISTSGGVMGAKVKYQYPFVP